MFKSVRICISFVAILSAGSLTANAEFLKDTTVSMPAFPGGTAGLSAYISSYHPSKPITTTDTATLIMDIDPQTGHLAAIHPSSKTDVIMELAGYMIKMPAWEPGKRGGQSANSQTIILVVLKQGQTAELLTDTISYNLAPSFKGGDQALNNYLSKRVRFTKAAKKAGAQGTVVVSFIIKADGTLDKITTPGPLLGYGLEEATVEIIKNMPAWNPGYQNGKPVSVQISLPINYSIEYSE
ncbi:energy transducer TonB [Chitinophaga sp. Cy-1792]|uniref:energy transducer TonB n=1 Tax=Chitinophaga sp. Cy-1792 TaxID=2608339 RepID=UPI0014211447|nr:energy transducer TonB [Chitinophaga sp. Cy-1792]NIG57330.1 energy transducer TonB [Chitinophaga sp. Cy-1792]